MARFAYQFFGFDRHPEMAAAIGKHEPPPLNPSDGGPPPAKFVPWSVSDFSRYLSTIEMPGAGAISPLTRLLGAMEHAGLLLRFDSDPRLPILGTTYITEGSDISPGQLGGNLWLAEVFGAELIIPSYHAVTMQLCGHDDDGNPVNRWGTGLIIDHTHIVTNKHVVTGLAGNGSGISVYPASDHTEGDPVEFACLAIPHQTLDIAVIEAQLPEGKSLPHLGGMAFRDPRWADEVYVFGYPRVPMTAEMALTVQRGEIVNPAAEAMSRQKIFLYSAIARPGNSGGPVVAQDGRVIGLVVEDSATSVSTRSRGHEESPPSSTQERVEFLEHEVAELREKAFAPAFYRGIPSSEVIRALDDLGFGGIIEMDTLP